MSAALETLVQEFGWIHTGIGMCGNATFVVGSVLFLPAFEPYKTLGVWLFIIGAALMLVGSFGDLMIKIYEARSRIPPNRAGNGGRTPAEADSPRAA